MHNFYSSICYTLSSMSVIYLSAVSLFYIYLLSTIPAISTTPTWILIKLYILDFGNYSCQADNSLGRLSKSIEVKTLITILSFSIHQPIRLFTRTKHIFSSIFRPILSEVQYFLHISGVIKTPLQSHHLLFNLS